MASLFIGYGVAHFTSKPKNEHPRVSYPLMLGTSGYILHFSETKETGEFAFAFLCENEKKPSISVNVVKDSVVILTAIERDGVALMILDKDGDGIPDEGIERDKKLGHLSKFKIEARRMTID
ncbi:MAG: hypothetical protein Q8M02_08100 [Candidatus Didemnitutus sp.]|nr:hypothetical protein [Candidatus Didemnitutus sp.]